MTFIGKNWFPLLIIGVLLFVLIKSQFKIDKYKDEIKQRELRIKTLNARVEKDLKIIDSLKRIDTVFIDRITKIKVETNEKIKLVDTMSISDMQSFYTNRYPEN